MEVEAPIDDSFTTPGTILRMGYEKDPRGYIERFVQDGSLDVFVMKVDRNCLDQYIFDAVIKTECLNALEYIHRRCLWHYSPGYNPVNAAAREGSLKSLQWLIEHGYKVYDLTMDIAAAYGHLEMAQWLDQYQRSIGSNTTFTSQAVDQAAGMGQYHVIEWLITNRKAPFTHRAIDRAASEGHLKIVQFLTEHGGTCTKEALNRAAANDHYEVVQWLLENHRDSCDVQEAMELASNNVRDLLSLSA